MLWVLFVYIYIYINILWVRIIVIQWLLEYRQIGIGFISLEGAVLRILGNHIVNQ